MRSYRIGELEFQEDCFQFQDALEQAFTRRLRPLCLCQPDGVPMYVARFEGQYLVKRMPSTGPDHHSSCEAFQPSLGLSAVENLLGEAIRFDKEQAMVSLRLGFSLSKNASRTSAAPSASITDTVKITDKRLSLRSLLHYLWQEAELCEWIPAWSGKRGWGKVRASLLDAARHMRVKSGVLSDTLFIPEIFHADEKAAIATRRAHSLVPLARHGNGKRQLMVLIGEVKECGEARSGQRLIVKHMPDFPLLIEERGWKRLQKTFARELAFWEADPDLHLVTILTFGLNIAGLPVIEEIALMITTQNWIPFETLDELTLLGFLTRYRQKSVKGLRFQLPENKPTVCVLLPEARPKPIAMFVVPADADQAYETALDDMISASPEIDPWIWRVCNGGMPPLP